MGSVVGAACIAASNTTLDASNHDRAKQYAKLMISKSQLSDAHIDIVQGYIRKQIAAIHMNTDLIIPREVMDLILFFYALQGSRSHKSMESMSESWIAVEKDMADYHEYHMVDLLYNDRGVQCQVTAPNPYPKLQNGNLLYHSKMPDVALMMGVAGFLRGIPQSSKQKIWTHAVTWEQVEGVTKVLDKTTGRHHVERLLCDLVAVFMKYGNGKSTPMKKEKVRKHVASTTDYIFSKYHPVKRYLFESEENYFAQMIDNWVTAKRCGLLSDGVGFRAGH